MKFIKLLGLLFAVFNSLQAQTDTLYYNGNLKQLDTAEGHSFYRVTHFQETYNWYDDNYYYRSGEIFITGKMISIKPPIKNGQYFLFDKQGNLLEEEVYSNNNCIAANHYYHKSPVVLIDGEKHLYNKVVRPPYYPGGYSALIKFLSTQVRFSELATYTYKRASIYLRFDVDKKGEISEIEIVKSTRKSLEQEAIRLLQLTSPWQPATQDGVPIDMTYTVPIHFQASWWYRR